MRIRTIMVAIVIVGLVTALLVRDREARQLQARLQVLEVESRNRAELAEFEIRRNNALFLELQERTITDGAASDSPHESNP